MLKHNTVGLLVGVAGLCLIITAYSVGRVVGMEQALKATASLLPEGKSRLNNLGRQTEPEELARQPNVQAVQPTAEADKELALADVKQVAEALTMYVQDYDETFPPNYEGRDFSWRIGPYLKDAAPLLPRGSVGPFWYTFDKKSRAKIAEPGKALVGYKDTQEGRVRLYADGSIGWQPLAVNRRRRDMMPTPGQPR